jgi:thiol-disulfide isomerase/thioredoxin
MSSFAIVRRAGGLLLLGCFLVALPGVGSGQTGSKFPGKAPELKVTDGKASYEGALTDDDPASQDRRYKVFAILLEMGKVYRIDHRNAGDDPKFDPFLFLEDPSGATIEADDDSGGQNDARILVKIDKTGTYRIVATTSQPKQTGKFKLEVAATTNASEVNFAEMNALVKQFPKAMQAERRTLAADVIKRLRSRGESVTVPELLLGFQLGNEAELSDVELARDVYKDLLKMVEGSSNRQFAGAARAFESSLKNLDRIGKPIEITGKTVDGKDFDLAKLKGKVVLVDFWATWCGPCVEEIPNMKEAYTKYHDKGFEVIGVSLDRTDQAIVKFTEKTKLPWPCINVEDSKKLAERYGVNAIPHPILIGKDGNIVSLRARGPALDRLLDRLLETK